MVEMGLYGRHWGSRGRLGDRAGAELWDGWVWYVGIVVDIGGCVLSRTKNLYYSSRPSIQIYITPPSTSLVPFPTRSFSSPDRVLHTNLPLQHRRPPLPVRHVPNTQVLQRVQSLIRRSIHNSSSRISSVDG